VPKFNLKHYNPDPYYIRSVIISKGYSNAQAAKAIGVSQRTVDAWCSEGDSNHRRISYIAQWALESLEGRK